MENDIENSGDQIVETPQPQHDLFQKMADRISARVQKELPDGWLNLIDEKYRGIFLRKHDPKAVLYLHDKMQRKFPPQEACYIGRIYANGGVENDKKFLKLLNETFRGAEPLQCLMNPSKLDLDDGTVMYLCYVYMKDLFTLDDALDFSDVFFDADSGKRCGVDPDDESLKGIHADFRHNKGVELPDHVVGKIFKKAKELDDNGIAYIDLAEPKKGEGL